MKKKYIENPALIERKSFEIIQDEINSLYGGYSFRNRIHEHIVKRVIHTSADFSYLETLVFTENFTEKITETFRNGCTIYTDTTMALSGINKRNLEKLGVSVVCLIADPGVAACAREKEITRSMAAVDTVIERQGEKVFVIGNAPTALYRIMENTARSDMGVKGIIGVPVGFVGARESKEILHSECRIPHVTSLSRKGGSNVAAGIVNAITYEMLK